MPITTFTSDDDNEITINVSGRFDFRLVQEFREAYSGINNPNATVIIDMHDAEYMDSSALGMLLNMQKKLDMDRSRIRIINCRPHIKKVFTISRFDKKFTIE